MNRSTVLHPFPPVADARSRVLILGSFPSVQSRSDGFYYGHPQNRFWKMLALVFHTTPPVTHQEKSELLLQHHLALWDAAASVSIEGSSDSSIRQVIPVRLEQVFSIAPVERILCNGALAGRLYAQYLEADTGIHAKVLPSTSPANAAWTLTRLTEAWAPWLQNA